jgi:predicted nucleic acid-binding protein
MAVVSNSSPLIAPAEIKQLDLLRRLFESVWIPRAVAAEVAPSLPTRPDWIAIRELAQPVPSAVLSRADFEERGRVGRGRNHRLDGREGRGDT